MALAIHPVDAMLPAPKLFTLGLQHALVMYAGAIAVPLIIGRVLQLPPEDVAFLISAAGSSRSCSSSASRHGSASGCR